ncbi:MAG: universal stress protein [Alphaproteobacteria bacterium]|jgi:nucleotide-binding universal stress UspA family protein
MPGDAPKSGDDSQENIVSAQASQDRVFLVAVDASDEMTVALRYACRRALHTGGRVALLHVIEPADFSHWATVDDLIAKENREKAENLLNSLSARVNNWAGSMPIIYVREGQLREELLSLIDEEPAISILVLAASPKSKGPGPLVSHIIGKAAGRLRIPVTIVPGSLSLEEVDAIS